MIFGRVSGNVDKPLMTTIALANGNQKYTYTHTHTHRYSIADVVLHTTMAEMAGHLSVQLYYLSVLRTYQQAYATHIPTGRRRTQTIP